MPTLFLDNRAIYYIDLKSETNTHAMMTIHGAGGTHSVWEAAFSNIPEVRLISLDLPGHGRSDKPGRRTIDQYAEVIERFSTALGLENIVLAGHSMGSAIALAVAQRAAIQVSRLILIGASARMPVADAIFEGVLSAPNEIGEYLANRTMVEAPDEYRQLVGRQFLATDGVTLSGDFLACNRFDLRRKLADIASPTLIIAGRLDPMVPLRFSESLSNGLQHSRLIVLEDTGHYAMLERPNEVRNLTSNFLNGLTLS